MQDNLFPSMRIARQELPSYVLTYLGTSIAQLPVERQEIWAKLLTNPFLITRTFAMGLCVKLSIVLGVVVELEPEQSVDLFV